MTSLELGQRVRMTGTVRKAHTGAVGSRTEYLDAPVPGTGRQGDGHTFTDGVIVGKRTVVTGTTHRYYDEPSYFVSDPDSARTVYLVAFHLRRKPAMCWPEQVHPLDES